MKVGTRFFASLSLCAAATTLAAMLATRNVTAAGGNPSANLDQCGNGPSDAPARCTGSAWQNGNTNASNSHWYEGDSIAYRMKFASLAPGSVHQVTIQWDTTKGGKHALDYLTSYNRTERDANDPCSGVAGCVPDSGSTYAIPPDPNTGLNLPAPGINPPAWPLPTYPDSPADGRWNQVLTMFGGKIQSVSSYSLTGTYLPAPLTTPGGDSSTGMTITFTADVANPVLAWGGHIASRKDWGATNSAVAITGSPFHMRLLALDGSGGNQDRSTSNSAVVFPAILTITKSVLSSAGATLFGPTPFNFTATSPAVNSVPEVDPTFTLVNNVDGNGALLRDPQTGLPTNQKQFKLFLFGTTTPQVTITEPPGAGFVLTDLSCPTTLNGVLQTSKKVDLASGTATIVANEGEYINCTYTNQQYATLTVFKKVVKTHGGTAEAGAFTLRVTGSNGTNLAGAGSDSGTIYALAPGTYTVSEDVPPLSGYKLAGFSGNCDASGTVVLGLGANKSCTVTNSDTPAHLTLVKKVTNDNGGTKQVGDFVLKIDATTVKSGEVNDVNAGAHVVSEVNLPGYKASAWGGDCAADGSIALQPGDNKTCTITNDDVQSHLTVVKTVVNDNGGTKQVADVVLKIDATAVKSGEVNDVNAGAHVVSEVNLPGYKASAWGGDCAADGSITLQPGDNKTCTITNDDVQPQLTVVKTVVNDNGGTKQVADFALKIDGAAVISGKANAVNAGAHVVSEVNLPGYKASAWGGDCAADGGITLQPGDNKTCTITNDDVQPQLTVVKTVVNDNGGTKQVADVALKIDGAAVTSGKANALNAGAHVVSEVNLPGYKASAWGGDCAADGRITLQPGDSKTCTITNDDVQPQLTVVKTVVNDNGGTKQVSDFALKIDAATVTSGTANAVNAGAHNVSEVNLPGYKALAWGGDCAADGSITLQPGDKKTCSIVNDDQPSQVTVYTIVQNPNGSALPDTVPMFATGLNASPTSFPGSVAGVVVTLNAGSFGIGAGLVDGYTVIGASGDCSGTIGLNASLFCTITLSDQKATPKVAPAMIWFLHDSLAVTGIRPGVSGATVRFKLYGPGDAGCNGPAINGDNGGGEVVPLVNGEAATINGYRLGQAALEELKLQYPNGAFRWIAEYSGDGYNNPVATACGDETHTISIVKPL
jgi:Prealbumin-like fold domain